MHSRGVSTSAILKPKYLRHADMITPPLFIYHIIFFTMQIDSNFLIALRRSWNPACWAFEVINPQAFWKLQAFLFHKYQHYSTLVLGIFMCLKIEVLDQFLLNLQIFRAAASHHCTCFQWTVIKFYKKLPKTVLLNFYASKASRTMTRIEEWDHHHLNLCL